MTPFALTGDTTGMARPEGRAVVVCDQWLGSNGYAGMKAMRRANWSVDVVPEWEFVPVRWRSSLMRAVARAIRPMAVREFNRQLVDAVRRFRPDVLLVFKGTFVLAKSLDAARSAGARAYCFFPDVSFRTHGPYLPEALRRYDWIFTTKAFGPRDLGEQLGVTRASTLDHAYDPDLHRPVCLSAEEHARYDCDVSFIGTWSPKKERLLSALASARPRVRMRIWGDQWSRVRPSSDLRRAIEGRPAAGEEYVRAIAGSAINLGVLSERRTGASDGDTITSRTFHIPASGGFLLHERTDDVLRIFTEGSSIACFDGPDELIARIDEFLPNRERRQQIAERGRATVAAAHSWDHRIREILARHEQLR